ncbi:MAG TPA: hypothetical protein VFR37_14820 [Longimicrobium sp.]|nr:hypothetical protein [Longimicrobium sp.]
MGRYIDGLPAHARDRVIQAQDWCVATVSGAHGARCLLGHAEDWQTLPDDAGVWRRWMDGEGPAPEALWAASVETLCRPELFSFRRARPVDLPVYRERLRRWGAESETLIGARFDGLCARRGVPSAIRLVKRRAGGEFAVPAAPAPPVPATAAG